MPTFRLSYREDGRDVDEVIQFEARDPASALHLAQRLTPGRVATLCEDDRPLCRIERRPTGETSDVWIIAPVHPI